jgi:hypothetical protein
LLSSSLSSSTRRGGEAVCTMEESCGRAALRMEMQCVETGVTGSAQPGNRAQL